MLGWKLNPFHFAFIVTLAIQQWKTKLDLHCAINVEAQTRKLLSGSELNIVEIELSESKVEML